jgi:hypothetical protein
VAVVYDVVDLHGRHGVAVTLKNRIAVFQLVFDQAPTHTWVIQFRPSPAPRVAGPASSFAARHVEDCIVNRIGQLP